jgi:hypothetical protein
MTVESFYMQDILIRNSRTNTLNNCVVVDKIKEKLQQNILYGNDALLQLNDDACYEPMGNATETALIRWL